jgi:hypothetical protein
MNNISSAKWKPSKWSYQIRNPQITAASPSKHGTIHWSIVLWRARKPNWLALSRPLCSVYLRAVFGITSSNSFPVVVKRLIGRKFWGNFGSLPAFGSVIAFVYFQGFGKWNSRRQWLNKCVRYTSGRLGRCLRHSFGIPSRPQAFLNFNEFADICMSSQGYFTTGGLPPVSSFWCQAPWDSRPKSELLYIWRFTVNQFVLAANPLRLTTRDFSTGP